MDDSIPCRRAYKAYKAPQSVEERDRLMADWGGEWNPSAEIWLSVQPFEVGGFEGVVKCRVDKPPNTRLPWDIEPLARARLQPEERSEDSIESSRRRAKRMIRWHCKNIGADHLITFTTREQSNSPFSLWSKLQRFVPLYRKATGEDLAYVAVPEPHPTNPEHWHLHIATHGFFKVNIARHIWWAVCGGDGQGNVQAERIKVRQGGWRAARIASYISKYVTKALITSERFNKKRYSVAKSILAHRQHMKLEANTFGEAMNEISERFGIRLMGLLAEKGCLYVFPEDKGFWFQIPPSGQCTFNIHDISPPF